MQIFQQNEKKLVRQRGEEKSGPNSHNLKQMISNL